MQNGKVNFGDWDMYVQGGGIPAGKYVVFFDARNHQGTKKDGTKSDGGPRLGIMCTFFPFEDLDSPKQRFLSMGTDADKMYVPDEDGLGIVPVAGAQGGTLVNSSNWALFFKSMLDCGLPKGVFTGDLRTINGAWVVISPIPEPAERSGFKSNTSEAQQERKGGGTIPTVTEFLPDGAPWENGGGLPDGYAPPAVGFTILPGQPKAAAPAAKPGGPKPGGPGGAKVSAPAPAAAAPKAAPGKKAAPAPVAAAEPSGAADDDEDIKAAAITGLSKILEKAENAAGMKRIKLRTAAFTAIGKAQGDDMAQAFQNYVNDDEKFASVLSELGYVTKGADVVPEATA